MEMLFPLPSTRRNFGVFGVPSGCNTQFSRTGCILPSDPRANSGCSFSALSRSMLSFRPLLALRMSLNVSGRFVQPVGVNSS